MLAFHSVLFRCLCECCDAQPATLTIDVPGDQALPVQLCEPCFSETAAEEAEF